MKERENKVDVLFASSVNGVVLTLWTSDLDKEKHGPNFKILNVDDGWEANNKSVGRYWEFGGNWSSDPDCEEILGIIESNTGRSLPGGVGTIEVFFRRATEAQ